MCDVWLRTTDRRLLKNVEKADDDGQQQQTQGRKKVMSVEVWRVMRREEMRREDPRQYLKLGADSGTHDGLLASGPLRGAWRLTEGGKIRLQHQSCDKAAGEQIAIGIGIGAQAKVIRRSGSLLYAVMFLVGWAFRCATFDCSFFCPFVTHSTTSNTQHRRPS